jgi:F0F1-type ATP synthase assembly protein I
MRADFPSGSDIWMLPMITFMLFSKRSRSSNKPLNDLTDSFIFQSTTWIVQTVHLHLILLIVFSNLSSFIA